MNEHGETLTLLASWCFLALLSACNSTDSGTTGPPPPPPPPPPAVASVTVSPDSLAPVEGESVQLTATARDTQGNELTGRTITWSSTGVMIATVDVTGLVTGVSAGSASIIAAVEGQSDTAVVSVGFPFVSLSAGTRYTCGITARDDVYCWGSNMFGQLGTGTTNTRVLPAQVMGLADVVSLSVWDAHSCATTTIREAYCWGANSRGQLGNSSTTEVCFGQTCSTTPLAVDGNHMIATVSAGKVHTCGVTANGEAYCWGANGFGQLGNGMTEPFTSNPIPSRVLGGHEFKSVTLGDGHTCGVTLTGQAYCWGDNTFGQLGNGSTQASSTPLAVSGGLTFQSVSAGYSHACGVTTTGTVYCWGAGGDGELGTGATLPELCFGNLEPCTTTPLPIAGNLTYSSVSAGWRHTCALTTAGAAYCWGYNFYGQLGDSSTTRKNSPAAVAGELIFASVSAGGEHTCAVTAVGAGYCWGANGLYEFGIGQSFFNSTIPVRVSHPQ
jgi:alpha-tubulin suppressor-like RCC1 family protein